MKPYQLKPLKVPRFNEDAGFYTTTDRSKLMGQIKSKNTKPEVLLRKELWKRGFRYRLNLNKLPGKPDIVLTKQKVVIFVDGEFWHGYQWDEKKEKIKSNRGFWIPKIERNIQRDEEVNDELANLGWFVIRFWQQKIVKELNMCVLIIDAFANTPFHLRDNFDSINDFGNFDSNF